MQSHSWHQVRGRSRLSGWKHLESLPIGRVALPVLAAVGAHQEQALTESMGLCDEASRRLPASRSWALHCPRCGGPMRIIAFILEPEAIVRILRHIGEGTEPPEVLPARGPPQGALEFDQTAPGEEWAEVDQTGGRSDEV